MAIKDDILRNVNAARARVTEMVEVEAALRADAEAKQAQIGQLIARIAELEAMPGAWTEADIAEINGALTTLREAFDPDVVVESVLANTPEAPSE